ncbi:hypothetical protein DV515_00017306, partial [Chloebia gouldiae]
MSITQPDSREKGQLQPNPTESWNSKTLFPAPNPGNISGIGINRALLPERKELETLECLEEIPRPIQDSGNILKQGYLEKRSREPSFFGSEWHKRWCVLTQRNFLYYTNEKSKQPKGSFPIERYQAHLDSQLRKDSRKKCCFQLLCPGKRSYE